MRIRLFRAPTLAQAMGRVRAELGGEALILGSRRVADGVEVTAALEAAESPPRLRLPPASLAWHGVPAALIERLRAAPLAAALPFAPLALAMGAPPLLFAGPPGAGKTLTVARIATRLVMEGRAPLVVTADGCRAGASEQLAALTRVLGIELGAATHPVALARLLAGRRTDAPVLIDLPGSDPFQPQEREALAGLAACCGAGIAAVLSAGLDAAEAAELAAAYQETGADRLVATRLDCARRLGGVVAAAGAGLALAEAGIGPGVADGLVPFTPELLAERLARSAADRSP